MFCHRYNEIGYANDIRENVYTDSRKYLNSYRRMPLCPYCACYIKHFETSVAVKYEHNIQRNIEITKYLLQTCVHRAKG